jgi:hypothetical protein
MVMKFNLKNKPIMPRDNDEADVYIYSVNAQKWFEGFEKELNEELVYAENAEKEWRGNGKKPHRVDEEIAREWHGIIIAIKQVLGEEKE